MNRIVLIGGGGHARVVQSTIARLGEYEMVGYTDRPGNKGLPGLPYLGDDSVLADLVDRMSIGSAALAIGITERSPPRRGLHIRLKSMGLGLPALCSSSSIVDDDSVVGEGSVVFDGAIIRPDVAIGAACIVNTHATIEHGCRIGDYCHVAPGAILCGEVELEEGVLVGAGACVTPGRRIGAGAIIGAGSTVVSDLAPGGIYVGSPARQLRK